MLHLLLVAMAAAEPEDQILTNADGSLLKWSSLPINFVADPTNDAGLDEDGAVAAIVGAAGAWSWVDGSAAEYRFRGVQRGVTGGYDDQNVVYFAGDWDASEDLLAVTSNWSKDDGELVDFDLAVNTEHHQWSLDGEEGVDLQNALTHEFGHALGLGHDEHEDATMYPSAPAGEVSKRDLAASDIAVIQWHYPDLAGEPIESVEGRRAVACATSPAVGAFAASVAALAVLRRRNLTSKEAPCSSRS